jgi:hypothetical protein
MWSKCIWNRPGKLALNLLMVGCFTISHPVMSAVLRSSIVFVSMLATIRFRMAHSISMGERPGELAGQSGRMS